MLRSWRHWGLGLALGSMLMLGPGAVSLRADGMDRSTFRGSDSEQFGAELQSRGALKFSEDTEDLLRAGRFERAFSRYLFLSSRIRGQSLYAGLAATVDQRLHFLRGQLRLGEESLHYAQTVRRTTKRVRQTPSPTPEPKAAPAAKPAADQSSPDAGAAPTEKPGEVIITPAGPEDKKDTPPKPESQPLQEDPKTEKVENGEKPADKPPPPPPSAWEKIKRRLKFW
jgi:hypothetical protein